MSSPIPFRLELPAGSGAPAIVRSFVSSIARTAGVPDAAVEDLRIAVAELVRASAGREGRQGVEVTVQVHGDRVEVLAPAPDDPEVRAALLSALGVDVDPAVSGVLLSAAVTS